MTWDEKAKHAEAMTRNDAWQKYQDYVIQRDGHVSLPAYFSKLNCMDKRACVGWWMEYGGQNETPYFVKEWVKTEYLTQKGRKKEQKSVRYQGKQFLFTCNGDWGLVHVPKDVSLSPVLSEAIEQLKNLDAVKAVW